MKKAYSAYYRIMVLACAIPGIALVALSGGTGKDWVFFSLLLLSTVGFMVGVLLVNWKEEKGAGRL